MEANLSNLVPSRFLSARSTVSPYESSNKHSDYRQPEHHLQSDSVSISEQAKIAYSEFKTRESSIEILTSDGDKVTISLSTSTGYQTNLSYSNLANSSSRQTEFSAFESKQTSVQYQLSIEGNIDSQERDAIENLVHDISEVADKLYQGDIKSAFKEASSLEYNTDELQSYSYNLTQTNSRQYTAAYEEIARFNSDSYSNDTRPASFNLLNELKELAGKTIKDLENFFKHDQIDLLLRKASDFFELEDDQF